MKNQTAVALIVARPGPLRNSLSSLMNTLPQIEVGAEISDIPAMLRLGSQIKPDLLLMEANLPGGHFAETLRCINLEWTATRTVVLVDNIAQQESAQLAGADIVLYNGFRAARLLGIIEDLLMQDPSPRPELSTRS